MANGTGSQKAAPAPPASPERAAQRAERAAVNQARAVDPVPQAVTITGTEDGEDGKVDTEADLDMDMEADGTMTMTPAAASLESLEVAENPASPDPVPQAVMTSDMDTEDGDGEAVLQTVMITALDIGTTSGQALAPPSLASPVDVVILLKT